MSLETDPYSHRCVGVVGGVFVCMGYAVRITSHAVDVVTGADKTPGIVAAEATGAGRKRWGSGELRSRVPRHGSDYGGSPYGSYSNSPVSAGFANLGSPYGGTPTPGSPHAGYGLGLSTTQYGPPPPGSSSPRMPSSAPGTIPTAATAGSAYSAGPPSPYLPSSPPTTAGLYGHFPPTPNATPGANGNGFPQSPPGAGPSAFSAQPGAGAPPPRANGLRHSSHGSPGVAKKDD